jgi:hypothetical protein
MTGCTRPVFLFKPKCYHTPMHEEKVSKEIKMYAEMARKDKSIDVASLMINALEKPREASTVSDKQRRWAYMVSIGLPPIGFIFALKFLMTGTEDGRRTAMFCAILTLISLVVTVILMKTLFSGAGVDPQQLQQLKPQDIQNLVN